MTFFGGHLQDVILPRILDDATLGSFNTMIHSNNASVSVSVSPLVSLNCFPFVTYYDIIICL
jgi:hypothetical protein